MKLLNSWTDDHLPCFDFEHEGVKFEVNWSSRKVEGRLELVQDGDLTLEVALKKYPDLLAIIKDPYNCQSNSEIDVERCDERDIDGNLNYYTSIGNVQIMTPQPK